MSPDWDEDDRYDDEDDGLDFAEPGGNSALRAATRDDPRSQPCPTCHCHNRLTKRDVALGYQCDQCANAMERGADIQYCDEEDY